MEDLAVRPLEAAKALGVGRSLIYSLLRNGQLPSIRVGKAIRVPADGLREWLRKNQLSNENKGSEMK